MSLKARLPNLDGLDEAAKKLYRQEGDFFVLDVEAADGWALEDVSGLKSALGAQKTANANLTNQVKAYKNEDGTFIDPAAAREAVAKLAEFGNLKPEELGKAKVKEALDQANAQHKILIDAKEAEIKRLTGVVSAVMIDQVATAALAKAGGNVKLLLPHVKATTRVVKDDKGDFKVEVFDSAGNSRIATKNGAAGDMTIDDLVSEMAGSTDFGSAFDSKSRSGGGSQQGAGNRGGGPPKRVSADDQKALSMNLEDIANGKVQVDMGTGQTAAA